MLPTEFDGGVDAPPGASAVVDGGALVLTWPSTADDRRGLGGGVGALLGLAVTLAIAAWFPAVPGWVYLAWVVAGAGAGVLVGTFLPRSFVTLTATPARLRVTTSGVLAAFAVDLPREEVLDVLVIEEQDGQTRDGDPIMVHRLVAPRRGGGRVLLVRRLRRSAYGHWVEACYARWEQQRRAPSA